MLPSASPVHYDHASMEDALPEGLQLKNGASVELPPEIALKLRLFQRSPRVGVWQRELPKSC